MPPLHAWDVSPVEAVAIQRELADRVREAPLDAPVETIGGVDVSVRGDRVRAAVVVLRMDTWEVVDQAVWEGPVAFPYVPGLLSFREIPALLPALDRLEALPDVLMTDSQGRAHPRRMGLGCHLGVWLDHPVVGVAKSRLTGRHDEPGTEKGAVVPLMDRGEQIGAVVRTRTNVKPVYVSVGHRMTLEDAVRLTLACAVRYRLPEPTRRAHLLSKNGP